MAFLNFSTPHCHLQSLDSGSSIKEFIKRELDLGTGTLTCTDHGYLGACRDVYKLAKDNKLIPILGCESYFRPQSCSVFEKAGIHKDEDGTYRSFYKYGHITLHTLDQSAYEALIQAVSMADLTAEQHGSERKPIFTWDVLESLGSHNTTMTSGCLIGVVGRLFVNDYLDLAVQYYEKIRSIPKKGNFYVELFPHVCDKNWVSGVFITLEDGAKLKYYLGKKVKTEFVDEISVVDLSKMIKKEKVGKLIAIKNRKKWEEIEPREIVSCELIQDFLPNECTDTCPNGDLQLGLNKFLFNLAQKYGDKLLISDDSHYAFPDEKIIQEIKLKNMGDNFRFYGSYHRYSSDEAFKYFHERMEFSEKQFQQLLDNNKEWSLRFKDFKLENKMLLPTSFYPKDTINHLMYLIEKHGRMNWSNSSMVERLKIEMDLLYKNGHLDLLPYFFLGEEVPDMYIRNGRLPGSGRGSAGSLLVSYLLGITHFNPLKYNLDPNRFITPDRIILGIPPDIDQDLPDRDLLVGKDESGGWLKQRFGDCYAQISTNTMSRLRNSIKDVARAFKGEVSQDIEKLCASLPTPPQGVPDDKFIFGYVGDDLKEVSGLLSHHQGLQNYTKQYPDQWEAVKKLLGIVREKSRHASAFIVSDKPIHTFIPLMTVSGVRVTQYTDKACEASGALKMDYLCLKTLLDLEKAIKLIQKRSGKDIPNQMTINNELVPKVFIVPHGNKFLNIYNLPDDQKVYDTISEGQTETVFQVNTSSSIKWLDEFNYIKVDDKKIIDSIDKIAIFTALDRPGTLDAYVSDGANKRNILQEYAARERGLGAYEKDELLDKLLPETKGLMIFQEGLSKVYRELTGCSGAEAEAFRRNVGKKEKEKILKLYSSFIERAGKKIGEDQAKKMWDKFIAWSAYGFTKAHAVAYAHIAYACAYLKHYFPLEWWCAVLSNADKNKITENFWKHCKEFSQFPDINKSTDSFEIVDDKIMAPISLLKGVGPGAQTEINTYRPYKDIDDFCEKIVLHKKNNGKPDSKTGKIRLGHSALDQGVVSGLIVSSVMDSLFPSNLRIIEKLEMYEKAMTKAQGGNPIKINKKYADLNSLEVFQIRKSILPIYTQNLVEECFHRKIGIHTIKREINGKKRMMYTYFPDDPKTISYVLKALGQKELKGSFSIFDGSDLKFFNESDIMQFNNGKSLKAAGVGYVLKYKKFNYKDKQAAKFLLDIDGEVFDFVKWPNWRTKELVLPEEELEGAIVVVLLSRWTNKYPFSLDAIIPIQKPLEI